MIPILILLLAYVTFLLLKYRDRGVFTTARPDLKGPKGLPLIGNLLDVLKRDHEILEMNKDNWEKYGPFVTVTVPGLRQIDCSRPDLIEAIQKTQFNSFAKGDFQISRMGTLFGPGGIFAADGPTWYNLRKTTSHVFSATAFRGVITNSIEKHRAQLIKDLDLKSENGKQDIPLNRVFSSFALDTFMWMTFGHLVEDVSPEERKQFATAFDRAQATIDKRFRNPFWKISERFTEEGRRMAKSQQIIDNFAYSIIEKRQQMEKTDEQNDLLAIYMNTTNDRGNPLTKQQLRDAILNLVIAGRDTTSQAISWTFFQLISKQKYIDIVRQEVEAKLGDADVDYDNFRTLPHTMSIFYETLRLWPSVSKNSWFCQEDTVLDGVEIKRGEIVRWSDWQMGRDKSIWGEDAEEWKPERWLERTDAEETFCKKESQYKFHAFNGGNRLCLGKDLATYEGIAVIVALVRRYQFEFAPGYLESTKMTYGAPKYMVSLTHPMLENMMVRIKERNNA